MGSFSIAHPLGYLDRGDTPRIQPYGVAAPPRAHAVQLLLTTLVRRQVGRRNWLLLLHWLHLVCSIGGSEEGSDFPLEATEGAKEAKQRDAGGVRSKRFPRAHIQRTLPTGDVDGMRRRDVQKALLHTRQ